jgi:hypothetical protein
MTPNTLTDEQVVRVLAEQMGYRNLYQNKRGEWFGVEPGETEPFARSSMPNYLESRDALAPVLAGLSEREWSRLHVLLNDNAWEDHAGVIKTDRVRAYFLTKWLLTLPPADLARAIASVLTASKERA